MRPLLQWDHSPSTTVWECVVEELIFLDVPEANMRFHEIKQDLLINIVFNLKDKSSAVSFASGLHAQSLCAKHSTEPALQQEYC